MSRKNHQPPTAALASSFPENDAARLGALADYHVLDSPGEKDFDDLTRLAAQICGTPIALISLVDERRQWFKSRVGLEATETPREISFCVHALDRPGLLIIPDAALDGRFAENPLVTGEPHIRFYAGAPLLTRDGLALGTLCVIDRVPRELTPEQLDALEILSRQVMTQLDLRRGARERAGRERLLHAVTEQTSDAVFVKDLEGRYLLVNQATSDFVGREKAEILGRDDRALFDEESAALIMARDRRVRETGRAETEEETISAGGNERTFLAMKAPYRNEEGEILGTIGVSRDITRRTRAEAAVRASEEFHRSLVTSLAEGVVLHEADGRIISANPMAGEILGLTPNQINGRTPLDPRWHAVREDGSPFPGEEHPAMIAMHTGKPQIGVPMGVYRPDGSLVWISINAQPVLDHATGTVRAVVSSFADVTAQKRAEAIEERHKSVLELIATGTPMSKSLDALMRLIEGQAGEMICSVLLLDPDGIHMRNAAGPRIPPEFARAIEGLAIGPEVGSCGTAMFRRQAVFVENIATDPLWKNFKGLALAHDLRACWSTPILDRDRKLLGTFAVYFNRPALPNEHHVQMINLATHTAAIAINRHRSEAALRASERRYRQLVDALPVAVSALDADGRLTLFNEAAVRLWGRIPTLGVDRWCGALALFDAEGNPVQHGEHPLATHPERPFEETGIELAADRPDGSRVHFLAYPSPLLDDEGEVIGEMNVFVDITERRMASRAIRLWADAFHYCALGMAVGDPETNLVLACNPAYARMLGRSPGEIAGVHIANIYAPDAREDVLRALAAADATGTVRFEAEMVRADGTVFTAQVDVVTVREESGEPMYRIATVQDISQRKIADAALKKAYDDLRQTQEIVIQQERLRAFGQMASGVAHDINNAICPVSIYTAVLLKTEPALSERAREYLGIIHQAAKGVGDTVSRLRKFSRPREEPDSLMPVLLPEMIAEVVALTRACWSDMAQERGAVIQMRTEIEPDLSPVAGIGNEIGEALINLIFNAVDAMPDGGVLTIRAHSLPTAPGNLPRICLEVADSGSGMNEEARRGCLEPFYTTKGERGTGLGLSIVIGILDRHSAQMSIESELGAGTTIRITFPASATMLVPVPEIEIPAPVSSMSVLVIDDEPLVLTAMRIALQTLGHRPHCVAGGQAAIIAFHASLANQEPFDVVVTDLGMPHVDGRAVAAAVKAASPATPVVLLTGWGHAMKADAEIPPGVDHILAKPSSPDDLNRVLTQCDPRRR